MFKLVLLLAATFVAAFFLAPSDPMSTVLYWIAISLMTLPVVAALYLGACCTTGGREDTF